MALITVLYASKPGAKFDMDYYLAKHMPMVTETWSSAGLRGYKVLKGSPAADGAAPPFHVIATLDFTSAEAFGAAVASGGAKVMGDVPNFTDIAPTLQVNEVVGEG
jgi:uncharacterized protein (TIGR02118 family)